MQARHLVLIGMPGTGKSTIGRLVARRLGRPFVDSDHEIEIRCGVRIPVIFELEGEPGFRDRESSVLADLAASEEPMVLATGGGAVLRETNREHLRATGLLVYLHSSPTVLWHRTRGDKGRPLLQAADPRARMEE
ncbi:shikimate kinase, partial [Derxia lacustris]|uniref:shikimate kinase n=1 Tax=Derxia lacustris TaxID=764842 RepID=UPI000A1754E5